MESSYFRALPQSAVTPDLISDRGLMKVRIGLIGLGDAWQTRHRPALRMLHDRFDVRAVFSSVAKLAENSASEFQADVVDGYRTGVSL